MTHGSFMLRTVAANDRLNGTAGGGSGLPSGAKARNRSAPSGVTWRPSSTPSAAPVVRIRKRNRLRTASGSGTGSFSAAADWTSGRIFSTASRNCSRPSSELPLPLGGEDPVELLADGGEERVAVQVLVLVEVVADAHAQGVERRGLVGEAGDEDGDDVRVELDQVFEQPQAVATRCRGSSRGRPGRWGARWRATRADSASGTAWTSTFSPDPVEPVAERAADGLLVVHDQDGFGHRSRSKFRVQVPSFKLSKRSALANPARTWTGDELPTRGRPPADPPEAS